MGRGVRARDDHGAAAHPALQTGKADLVISTLSITRSVPGDRLIQGYAVLPHGARRAQERQRQEPGDLGRQDGWATVRAPTTHDTQLTREGQRA